MKKAPILSILFLLMFFIGGFASSSTTNDSIIDDTELIPSASLRLWRDTAPLYSMVVGDADLSHAGSEIFCGGASNKVTMLSGSQVNWDADTIFNTAGTVEFLNIGDVDSSHSGNEVVVGTFQQHSFLSDNPNDPPEYWGIRVLEGYGAEWSTALVFATHTSMGKLWSLRVGDFNTTHPGDEICGCWEFLMDIASVIVYTYNDGMWSSTLIYSGNMVIMDANVGEFNTSHDGSEVILLDEDGDYLQLIQKEDIYTSDLLWEAPDDFAGREVEIGDVDPLHPGNELVVRTRFLPGVILLEEWNSKWVATWVLKGSVLVTDLIVDDLIQTHGGDELVVIRDRNVTMLWNRGQRWYPMRLWTDTAPLCCIGSGDFDISHTGRELAVAGDSQFVTRVFTNLFLPFAVSIDQK